MTWDEWCDMRRFADMRLGIRRRDEWDDEPGEEVTELG